MKGRYLTEKQLADLITCSNPHEPLQLFFGGSGVTLRDVPENKWAFDLLENPLTGHQGGNMRGEGFEVTWEADDGYVGGSAPHIFYISEDDIYDGMDEEELKRLFWTSVQENFEQRVSPVSEDEEAFIGWAQTVIEKQKEAEEDED